MIHYFNRILER